MIHKSQNLSDSAQVSNISEQITPFCTNWTSGSGSLRTSLPLQTHITPSQQCRDCSDGSIEKLFLCAAWHTTSASHSTHRRIISLPLSPFFSLSRDELCPEDKLQRWISIIVSLLHSCCESGDPILQESKSVAISVWIKGEAVLKLIYLVTWESLYATGKTQLCYNMIENSHSRVFELIFAEILWHTFTFGINVSVYTAPIMPLGTQCFTLIRYVQGSIIFYDKTPPSRGRKGVLGIRVIKKIPRGVFDLWLCFWAFFL